MTKSPILIAQISDLHVKAPGHLAYRRVDTALALSRCVDELNRFVPRIDLVVISGDLADTPSTAEYDHLKSLLAGLAIPFVAVPGNHDSRGLMRAAFPDHCFAMPSGALNRRVKLADLDLLLLDSSVPVIRMVSSMTIRCTGWTPNYPLARTGRRCCSCIIRPLPRASGTWTGRICAMPTPWPRSSRGIRASN